MVDDAPAFRWVVGTNEVHQMAQRLQPNRLAPIYAKQAGGKLVAALQRLAFASCFSQTGNLRCLAHVLGQECGFVAAPEVDPEGVATLHDQMGFDLETSRWALSEATMVMNRLSNVAVDSHIEKAVDLCLMSNLPVNSPVSSDSEGATKRVCRRRPPLPPPAAATAAAALQFESLAFEAVHRCDALTEMPSMEVILRGAHQGWYWHS